MKSLLKCSLLIVGFLPFLTGCYSTVIDTPGIEGFFVEQASGKPISGVKVIYTVAGRTRTEETVTNKQGFFHFDRTLKHKDEVIYCNPMPCPGNFVSFQLTLELRLREKQNFSSVYHFSIDVNDFGQDAIKKVGIIKVNRVFLLP